MSQVTVTDVRDVTKMKKSEILKWINRHLLVLFREAFTGVRNPDHGAIIDDLKALGKEYKTR